MKKFALILAFITVFLMLVSCGDEKEVEVVTEDIRIDVNTGKRIDKKDNHSADNIREVTPGTEDYDSEGNLIVKSTENRYVYRSELGYIIFTFNQSTGACTQVLEVRSLKNKEEATEYLTENIIKMMDSGNYLNVHQANNNAVFTVSFDNPVYGKYLALTREDVEKDMPEEMKCN